MDRRVRRHLADMGVHRTRLPEEDTFTRRAPDFMRWFHEEVMGFDPEEYRRAFWREASVRGHTIGRMPYGLREYIHNRALGGYSSAFSNLLAYCAMMGGSFAVWLVRREIDRHLGRLRRPMYYEAERRRRQALAEERRRIRARSTLNPRPTPEALREAFTRRGESHEAALRLGSMLEDLECYVDNSARVVGGCVVGRRPGVKGWLHDNALDLYVHYKRLMHYKALAKRFRQAAGIADPIPAAEILPPPPAGEAPAPECHAPSGEGHLRDFTSDGGLAAAGWKRVRAGTAGGTPHYGAGGGGAPGTPCGRDAAMRGRVGAARDGRMRDFSSDGSLGGGVGIGKAVCVVNAGCLGVARGKARELLAEARLDGRALIALEAQLAKRLEPMFSPLSECESARSALYENKSKLSS